MGNMHESQSAPDAPLTLSRKDLPAIYRAASDTSQAAQRRFQFNNAAGLFLLVVAAVAGLFTWQVRGADWAGVVAAFAFFLGLILQIDHLVNRPERTWYEGRAVAESGKTLGWRYAVGGAPFRVDTQTQKEADDLFARRVLEILTDVKAGLVADPTGEGDQITYAMRGLRARSLAERRAAYASGRLGSQRRWYAQQAALNRRRAALWNSLLLLAEVAGAAVALLKVAGIVTVDLLGLATTLAAIFASWLQLKQHAALAHAYAITAQELATIQTRVDDQTTEEEWALFVDNSEGAISREHTLWRASHTDTK